MSAPAGLKLRLVADERTGVMERRRGDCASLGACETEWTLVHGGAQARCRVRCEHYEPREAGPLLSGGGGIVMAGASL